MLDVFDLNLNIFDNFFGGCVLLLVNVYVLIVFYVCDYL